MDNVAELLGTDARNVTIVGILLVILVTGYLDVWMFSHLHREIVSYYEERLKAAEKAVKFWRELAVKGTRTSEELVEELAKALRTRHQNE